MNKLFCSYIVVGGMPQVVQTFVDTHDIGKAIADQEDILELYRLDIAKYAEDNDKVKIKSIFDSIPSQLNDKNRRFYVNALEKNARMNRYNNSFQWLADAGVALPCYNVNEPQPPLSINSKHSLFKLFMNDTGLLCAACMDNIQFDLLNGRLGINMGSILENLVAQQLKAGGLDLYYYASPKHGEVDFVIQKGTHVDLLEVKSGTDYKKHKALDNVASVRGWSFDSINVLCRDDLGYLEEVRYIPWYMIMFIHAPDLPKNQKYEVDLSGLSECMQS